MPERVFFMNILTNIKIENYKSFTNEVIDLNDITCFVGPNESGKTNLLDAIYHLSKEKQTQAFKPGELRLGAPNFPNGEISITYTLKLRKSAFAKLINKFPKLEDKTILLIKKGVPKAPPQWTCNSKIPHNTVLDICRINNKRVFINSFSSKNRTKEIRAKSEVGWFINDSTVDLRSNPYKKLLSESKLELLKKKEKVEFINNLIREAVLENIKIYFWKYEEAAYLKEKVSISDLIQKPENYRSVTNMFLISGWKKEEFPSKLQGQNTTIYDNLLIPVKRNIDSLIKNNWSTHNKLKIEIRHDGGDNLIIHLVEPGSATPPEFRSDGLKWFLTFLINFRALSKTISNYILLIDEPGLHLHPRGQKDVLEELETLAGENQIVYSTHQTFLINKNRPDRVRIIRRSTQRSGSLSSNPFYASKVANILNPKNILTDDLLREALGFKVSDISPINEKNILVEGVFDREIFYITNEVWKILDLNKISIISCGKASNITKHAALYQSNDLKVVCFYDSDNPGKSSCRNNSVVSKNQKRQIRNIKKPKEYETMEDLLPDAVFDTAVSEWFTKWKVSVSNVRRPRMKNLGPVFTEDKKTEMKHDLEDIIVRETTKHIKKHRSEYEIFKSLLEDIKSRLS